MSSSAEIDLRLHNRQAQALQTEATEVLYGGAAGGGKSHLMRCAAIIWCTTIPGLQVYIFRRIYPDLVKNHMEGPNGFRALLTPWVTSGLVSIVDDEIRFWNGSKIYLCHCKDEKDRFKYQGAEIHVLLIDELTHFTETIYRFLRGRVRAVGLTLPTELKKLFPRILCSSNPGNIGHQWVKRAFIDGVLPGQIRQMPDSEGGMKRQFIQALLEDNPSMVKDDPQYRQRLRGLGSEALVKAMESGDWDIIDGAFFDCWRNAKHVIKPFEIPEHWLRFRSGDWGSAKPFSFGWWAVVSDEHKAGNIWLPRGCMVRYQEWYGAKKDTNDITIPNVGLKLHAEAVGKGLAEREKRPASYGVLDPAAFAEDGGPSIASRIQAGSQGKIFFRRADNARVPQRGAMGGWDQLRGRLEGDEEDRPMIVTFSTCLDSIRTIPALQHDEARPEDLDSDMEDHAADEWRYACMSRPWVRTVDQEVKSKRGDYSQKSEDEDSWKTA